MQFTHLLLLLACTCLFQSSFAQKFTEIKPLRMGHFLVQEIDDRGWSYRHDFARNQVINIYGDLLVRSTLICCLPEDNDAEVEKVAREEMDKFDLIFTTSPFLVPGISAAAKDKRDTYWATLPPNGAVPQEPNVVMGFVRMFEITYLAGFLAGQVTRTNVICGLGGFKVDFVVRDFNAFAVGAYRSNPDVKMYVAHAQDWIDQRKHRQITEDMMARKCDVLFGYVGTFWHLEEAMDKGNMFIVALNSDAATFFPGGPVLTSCIYNWLPLYEEIVGRVYNGTWKENDFLFPGLVDGAVALSAFHPDVTDEQATSTVEQKNLLLAGKSYPFCGNDLPELAEKIGPNFCLSNDDVTVYAGAAYFKTIIEEVEVTYYYNELFVSFDDPLGILFTVINAVLTAILIAYLAVVGIFWRTPVMRAATPLTLVTIGFGGLLGHAAIFLFIAEPEDGICVARLWLSALAITIVLATLIVKFVRIFRLFMGAKSLKIKVIPMWQVGASIAGFCLVTIVICAVWTGVGTPVTKLGLKDDFDNVEYNEAVKYCDSDEHGLAFTLTLFVWLGLQAGGLCIVAFLTRNVKSAFAESKVVGVMVYNMTLVAVILLPIIYSFSEKWRVTFIIKMIGGLYILGSTMALLYVPKVVIAFTPGLNVTPALSGESSRGMGSKQ
mmetsp:Transcript_49349/g.124066  ORF Transcript_49349/g.124066 Transcript_49349/m.124066 type:complete len:663 (-) Transcript_49349:44-2032(-)|eukprot:CAMPEP_0177648488 /NCGR_PEP_ID=MMETSP0447-20121125/10854_1 /TAXON_ID=0 /ORGANISM="Stygamoeba regulata, Strain BSH-02190019" /LENGTH=662 /DNA_ID=CAMNT_0019151131 /DNA_START=98 /DNA_END=2086 /DNA_ORIENTATION=-